MKSEKSLNQLFIFIAVFFALWAARVFLLQTPLRNIEVENPGLAQILSDTVRFFVWVVPVFVYLHFITKEKQPLRFLHLTTPMNWQWVAYLVPPFLLWVIINIYIEEHVFNPKMSVFVFIFFKILAAPIMEEILFRGFIQNALLKHFSFFKTNIIQAVLFICAHFAWIYFYGLTMGVIGMFVQVFLMGLVLGFVARKTNSIIPAIIYHLVNNVFLNLKI